MSEAWEQAFIARRDEARRLTRAHRWAPATAALASIFEGLRRADPMLHMHHAQEIEALAALWARAAWESTSAPGRAAALEVVFLHALDFAPELRLQQVLDAAEGDPPGLTPLLAQWTRALGDWGGRWRGRELVRGRLQREALRLHLGADGLGALARQSDELDVWLAWVDALLDEGRAEEALRAAVAGSRSLYWPRHRLQMRLREGLVAARLGQEDVARRAWRDVWRHRLCMAGLCMVWEVAGPLAAPFFREELDLAYSEERPLPVDLQVRLEILLGDAEIPVARLQAADNRAWWESPQHPAAGVLPLLLRLGTHQPILDETLIVTRTWRGTDNDGRWRPRPPDPIPTGWSSLVDHLLPDHPTWLHDAVAWRVIAANSVIELAGAALAAHARGTYLRVAALLVALVEAGVMAEDPDPEAPLRAIQRRFPRHKALLRTIDTVRQYSPLLRPPDSQPAGHGVR